MDIYKTITSFTPNTNQPELRVGFVTWLSDCDLTSAADITPILIYFSILTSKMYIVYINTVCSFSQTFKKLNYKITPNLELHNIISILQNQII